MYTWDPTNWILVLNYNGLIESSKSPVPRCTNDDALVRWLLFGIICNKTRIRRTNRVVGFSLNSINRQCCSPWYVHNIIVVYQVYDMIWLWLAIKLLIKVIVVWYTYYILSLHIISARFTTDEFRFYLFSLFHYCILSRTA